MFCQAFFYLLVICDFLGKENGQNAALKMLLKLAPAISFINILQAAFGPIFLRQKIQSQTVSREKLCKTLSYKNG
jgi:hypothetical protein